MKKLTFALLTFIISITSLIGQDLNRFQKKLYVHQSDSLPYRMLLPNNYDSTKSYPLVLFLHGAGERGNDNEKQLTHGASLFLNKQDSFPAIVLFPQCPENSYWSAVKIDRTKSPLDLTFNYNEPLTSPLRSALALTKDMITTRRADPGQVYIIGLSMGGMGTFEAVHRNPKLFAAAIPICGGGDADHYNKKSRKVPFWVFHGADDAVVAVEESRAMVAKLKTLGANVKYTEYPGVNHNSWDNAFNEKELLPWMFSQQQ